MTFIFLKFLHVAFMFMGAALAIGPAAILYLLARSAGATGLRTVFAVAPGVFQVSTACYGLGIVTGIAAALSGGLDLTAVWLITSYLLVALLAAHGILFDRWTKRVAVGFGSVDAGDAERLAHLRRARAPLYLLSAMALLVVAIVFVMVTKLSFL
jgi:hypothetical protein